MADWINLFYLFKAMSSEVNPRHKVVYRNSCSVSKWRRKIQVLLGVTHGATMYTYIRYGNSEICAHIRNNLCYLICLRPLIRSSTEKNQMFFYPEGPILQILHACSTYSELPSNVSTMGGTEYDLSTYIKYKQSS